MNADALNLDELDYDEDEPVAAHKITNGHPSVVELQSDDEDAKNNRKSSVDQPDDKSDDGALTDSDDGEIKSGNSKTHNNTRIFSLRKIFVANNIF